MTFLDRPAPRWFTIPAHRPFVEDLAAGLYAALTPLGPEALSDAVVLTPTRRGARALAEAFLKVGGERALLLPQIRAIGDLDEGEPPFEPGDIALDLPPAISPWRRRFELARLVAAGADKLGRGLDAAGALELADALAGFLDSVEIEEAAPLAALESWVDLEMAKHWEVSADFLRIAIEAWPARLDELGFTDLTARRVALLRALGSRWAESPPEGVMVAAGSTGTAPAAAALLTAIARAPRGAVVLPGLDQELADDAWANVGEQHPQGAMKRLLAVAGVGRGDVGTWSPPSPGDARGRWRRRIINEALRPAEATADWLTQIGNLKAEGAKEGIDPIAEGLLGLSIVTARHEEEAAGAAALLLREALETPGRSAALVTPDAELARRVSARLSRWGVIADSSAGSALAGFPAGVVISLMARAVTDPVDPVLLLALAKHPFARFGLEAEDLARRAARLERDGLRGPRAETWEAIGRRLNLAGASGRATDEVRAELKDAAALLQALRRVIETAGTPFETGTAPPALAARALTEALETLTGDPTGDTGKLWSGAGGEAAASLLAALIAEGDGLPEATRAGFSELIDNLLAGETVRTGAAAHPRLHILGAIEARLVRADLIVLAGLEEGVWPAAAPVDPFLSRPMRKTAGLPPPERRIGLSAHDFAQAACAPEVVLLHSERRGGAPAVASRWLWRLETLARGAGVAIASRPELLDWTRDLDAPGQPAPAPRPRPTPPVSARPREMSVTGVERWVRDPYGLYARSILGLRPLERPGEPVEARARGTAIHAAFETFAKEHPEVLPEAAHTIFAAYLMQALNDAGMPRARLAREKALAANVAPWVIDFETRRRDGARLLVEQQGRLTFQTDAGEFTLTAKADRIELRAESADVLDFKTGAPPSKKQVEGGLAPQLTLTAAILRRGGFAGAGRTEANDLVYVRVSGGRTPGLEIVRGAGPESPDLAERALEGLRRLIALYEDPTQPYLSWAAPQFINQFPGDYDHLARLWEWHVIGEGESEGGGE